jgi:hypothetical protein
MREVFFVFRWFGFGAGMMFIFDSILRAIRRFLNRLSRKRFPIRFEDLTDDEARMTLWAAGISGWEDKCREEMNRIWNEFITNETIH